MLSHGWNPLFVSCYHIGQFFISNLAYGYFVVVVTFTAMSANENQCAIVF